MSIFQNHNDVVLAQVGANLTETFGLKVVVESSKNLGGGCINNASKISTNVGDFFLKWNSNCASDIFIREAESLKELKKVSQDQIFVPEVFISKKVDSSPGFLLMEYLSPGNSGLNNDEKLGRGLATIHKYGSEKFGFYHDNYCGATQQNNNWGISWSEFFRDKRLSFLLGLIQKERPIAANEMKTYEKLLNRIPDLIPSDSKPGLIHGDLWSGNYMMSKKVRH